MLKEKTLFGTVDKVAIAVERIKTFAPMASNINPAGYYVCISGGKDSSVIQALCMMAEVKCEFVHNHTSVDHPETVLFIRREKERMEKLGYIFRVEVPRFSNGKQKTMWNLIPKRGLPTMMFRWCCHELKEYGGIGRYCMTGIRWEESTNRSKNRALHEIDYKNKKEEKIILNNDNDMVRRLNESCVPKRKFVLNPIIDWTEADVWDFIKIFNIPYNPLYNAGQKRVGCIGCPMSTNKKSELENNPKYKDAYFRGGEKWVKHRIERGLDHAGVMRSAESYFDWWINI